MGRLGSPSVFACPECHGVLLQLKEGGHNRFRCHTGHAYSTESLLAQIDEQVEINLWNTIRAMHEGNVLMRSMSEHPASSGDSSLLLERAEQLHRHANTLREMVISYQGSSPDDEAGQ